jgi:hypothetical protein
MRRKPSVYVAVADYQSQNKGEISFSKGDTFKLLKQNKNEEA